MGGNTEIRVEIIGKWTVNQGKMSETYGEVTKMGKSCGVKSCVWPVSLTNVHQLHMTVDNFTNHI